MLDIELIDEPGAASAALDPLRLRILTGLREPASATALAERIGVSRQKVNYHLRTLESHGLVEPAGERRHGGITERLLVATAASYVISPETMGASAADPARVGDRLSARYLLAVAARLLREVGALLRRANARGERVATLAVDAEIDFATPDDRIRFADELTAAVTGLAARYHHDGGRPHRLVAAVHPIERKEQQ